MVKIARKESRSKLSLEFVLKKSKTNISDFLSKSGIMTYEELERRCERIGVEPPPYESVFMFFPQVTSQCEGIIVLEPEENLPFEEHHLTDENNDEENNLVKKKKKKSKISILENESLE